MVTQSSEWNALHSLTRSSFEKFEKNLKASRYYKKEPVYDHNTIVAYKILCHDEDPSTSIVIESGGRCPLIECMAMNYQCGHELVCDDGQFDLKKWGTRYWCDEHIVVNLVIMDITFVATVFQKVDYATAHTLAMI